jgi:hypothetical protein
MEHVMFKKFIDELIVLDEYSGKDIEYIKSLKKEDFTSLVMRVDIVQTWLNGISNLRNDLPCRKCGECQ